MGADSNLPVLRRGSAPVSKLEARQCRTRCEADSRKWSRSLRNCNGRERPFAGHREGRRWFVSLPRLHAYLRWRRNQITSLGWTHGRPTLLRCLSRGANQGLFKERQTEDRKDSKIPRAGTRG